jgi:hypothetical protein
MIEAESQAVLNTLTEHDFQDAFKEWQKRWERCIIAEGGCFEGDGGQKAQSYFWTRWQHRSRKLWITMYHTYTNCTLTLFLRRKSSSFPPIKE